MGSNLVEVTDPAATAQIAGFIKAERFGCERA